ncbi:hypothetical protein M0805_005153 [Coniferiporia weirii]|nr:hypothetical protein M0805_005153 [Coniferiporia weirii]
MQFFFSISAALVLALRVSAHGYPASVLIDGMLYDGANGPDVSANSPIRKVSSGDPVTDVTSNNIICGQSAQVASGVATAKPGSLLQFNWVNEGNGNWVHNTGPIIAYMAECSGGCTSFTPDSSTAWFKIEEQGEEENGVSGTWVQANLNSGAPANVTIPSSLAAGNYLVRHEIIALQNAQSEGGAEFYPSCLQLTVSGDGTGTPNTTVHFPGAYSATDPGILGNFYDPGVVYVFPGGDLVSIADDDQSSDSGSSTPSTSSSSEGGRTSPTGTGTSSPASSTSAAVVQCKVSKKVKLRRRLSPVPEEAESREYTPEKKRRRAISLHHKRRSSESLY